MSPVSLSPLDTRPLNLSPVDLTVVEPVVAVRRAGRGTAPSLSVRPAPAPGAPRDPLAGHEVWQAVTDCIVLLGPRPTPIALQLLDRLRDGGLNAVRLRMSADHNGSTVGTISAVTTLACWPERRRVALVASVQQAAWRALRERPAGGEDHTTSALGWLVRLSMNHPDDPLALAPLLLQLRRFRAGSRFLVAPTAPFAHLRGGAVGLAPLPADRICGGLAPSGVDPQGFAAALSADPDTATERPDAEVLQQMLSRVDAIARA